MEPTGNARFTLGKFVFMRIGLNPRWRPGTTVATRITTADSVRVVKLARGHRQHRDRTAWGELRQGEGLCLHLRQHGGERAADLRVVHRKAMWTANTALELVPAPLYDANVDGVLGASGMVLPNLLATGVPGGTRRALASGAVVASATDADGLWPSGAQTVNPWAGHRHSPQGLGCQLSDGRPCARPPFRLFGNVTVSASKTDSVFAKNTSSPSLTISSMVSSDTSAFAVTTSAPVTLAAGASKWIRIVFHPRITGDRMGRITFTQSGPVPPDTVHVEGSGIAVATSVVLPRYMEGHAGINTDRVPFACRLKLTKLLANKTYRFYNQMVDSSDPPYSEGSGNPIFATPVGDSATVRRFHSTGTTAPRHRRDRGVKDFVTRAYWWEPIPARQFVFVRISLNDAHGNTVATRDHHRLGAGVAEPRGHRQQWGRGCSMSFAKERTLSHSTTPRPTPSPGRVIERDEPPTRRTSQPVLTSMEWLPRAFGMALPNLLATGVASNGAPAGGWS